MIQAITRPNFCHEAIILDFLLQVIGLLTAGDRTRNQYSVLQDKVAAAPDLQFGHVKQQIHGAHSEKQGQVPARCE